MSYQLISKIVNEGWFTGDVIIRLDDYDYKKVPSSFFRKNKIPFITKTKIGDGTISHIIRGKSSDVVNYLWKLMYKINNDQAKAFLLRLYNQTKYQSEVYEFNYTMLKYTTGPMFI